MHVRKGCLSDEPDVPVSIRGPNGKFRTIRSTSQLEQLHSRYGQLESGTQVGPQVGHAVLQQFAHENNVSLSCVLLFRVVLQMTQSINWLGMPDLHTADLALLLEIHDLANRVLGSDKDWAFLDSLNVVDS